MDVRATKDDYERQEEEAERLVRPSPKLKPSRHDKKREDVHEHDPDTDGDSDLRGDPDMSVNYKDVGGSLVMRVVRRFATAPKDEKPKSKKWVKVRNKELDVGTRVRPETLIEEPSKYQKKLPNEPPERDEGKPRPSRKPERPHYHKDPPPHPPWPDPRPMPPKAPRPARPPTPVKPVPVRSYPEPEKQPKAKPPGWVPDRRKPASVVARFLRAKEFATKEEMEKYFEDTPNADRRKHWVKDDGIELSPDDKALDGVIDSPALEKEREKKKEKPKEEEAPKAKKDKKEDKAPPDPDAKGPKPDRKPLSKEEAAAVRTDIFSTFGVFGADLVVAGIHPKDFEKIKALAEHHARTPISFDKLDAHIETLKAAGLYQTDPRKIDPPKQARDKQGELVPFDSLPKDEQAEAWQQHRNEVLGASLALRQQAEATLIKSGAPKDLARLMAHAKLTGSAPSEIMDRVLEHGTNDGLDPKKRAKFLDKLKDSPKDRAIAARFFQGQDYLDVRSRFLSPDSPLAVSEHSSEKDLRNAIRMGTAILRERGKAYEAEDRDPSLEAKFRHRILNNLKALSPEKAKGIEKQVDEMDADDYDKAVKEHDKQVKRVEAERKKREKRRADIEWKFLAETQKAEEAEDYREAPKKVKPLEQRWAEAKLDPADDPELPIKPEKPVRYDLVRGTPLKAKNQYDDMLERMQEPEPEPEPQQEPPKAPKQEPEEEDVDLSDLDEKEPPKAPKKAPVKKPEKTEEPKAAKPEGSKPELGDHFDDLDIEIATELAGKKELPDSQRLAIRYLEQLDLPQGTTYGQLRKILQKRDQAPKPEEPEEPKRTKEASLMREALVCRVVGRYLAFLLVAPLKRWLARPAKASIGERNPTRKGTRGSKLPILFGSNPKPAIWGRAITPHCLRLREGGSKTPC